MTMEYENFRSKVSGGEIQTKGKDSVAPAARPFHDGRKNAPAATHPRPNNYSEVVIIDGDFKPSGSQTRILKSLAEFEALGRSEVRKPALAAMSGASFTSSAYSNNLGALRSAGLIHYPRPDHAALTDQGRAAVPAAEAPDSSEQILARCKSVVSGSQAKILEELAKRYPDEMAKQDLAEAVGASPNSSAFGNNLGALRTAGMIEYPRAGAARAAEWLFLEGAA